MALLLTGMSAAMAWGQADIADARNNYSVGQSVTVSGIVTSDSELGPVRYLQDASAGIALYPPASGWSSLGFSPSPGDSITITGELSEFASLLEVGPNISALVLESTGHPLPEPLPLSPQSWSEAYEGMLLVIEGAVFDDAGSTFGSSTYSFSAGGETGVVYIPSSSPLVGDLIPSGPIDLTGILSQHSYNDPNDGYQLLPRNADDLHSQNPINFTTEVVQTDMTTSQFTLSWGTDVVSTTQVKYGLTPEPDLIASDLTPATEHTITLTDLVSGSPYYCQVFSVAGEDTLHGPVRVYSTVSESSGRISAYFNRSVDTTVATISNAISLYSATDDTIIAQIDRAMSTLDLAIYNTNSGTIVQAVNNALDRGVTVRYIAEGQNANLGLSSLDSSIPVLYRQNATSSGMHNKFVIVDRDDVDNATVVTGSTNFTSNNLFSDPNNLVIVQDQALARAFTLEFEEMWGSDGPNPDPVASRFGELKTNNTPEKFIIGGRPVELYFSPTDNTTQAIEDAVASADYNLDFALLLLTNNILADAIVDRVSLFLQPRGILETISDNGSDYEYLLENGVTVVQHTPESQLHHKYATIDHAQSDSDPVVVTGSHNWTASAESTNDENTLIIHDEEIANHFFQEFMARFAESTVSTSDADANSMKLVAYPNPTTDRLNLTFTNATGAPTVLNVFDVAGKVVAQRSLRGVSGENLVVLSVGNLPEGVYVLQLATAQEVSTEKFVVGK